MDKLAERKMEQMQEEETLTKGIKTKLFDLGLRALIHDRWYHLKKYENVLVGMKRKLMEAHICVGEEFVQWLLEIHEVEDEISATAVGQLLLDTSVYFVPINSSLSHRTVPMKALSVLTLCRF